MQHLAHAGLHRPLAFTGGQSRRATEQLEKVVRDLAVPEFYRPDARRHSCEFLLDTSHLADRVEQHLGGGPLPEEARVVLAIPLIRLVGGR